MPQETLSERVEPMFGSLLLSIIKIVRRFKWITHLFRTPLNALGTLVVLGFLLLAIFGENVAPYAYDETAFSNPSLARYKEPDCFSEHVIHIPIIELRTRLFDPFGAECKTPFGTDKLTYDVFSRVILGTREIFRLSGFGTLFAVLIGSSIGLFIGYQGGLVDEIISRLLDSLLSIPALLLALVLIGTLPRQATLPQPRLSFLPPRLEFVDLQFDLAKNSLLVVLIIVYSPIVARVVRSNVLAIKSRGFVEAAQLRGESTFYILFREILPSVIPTLVVEASLRFSYGIFLVASLGFLGLGASPPTPNWGLMVNDAYRRNDHICTTTQCHSWTILYPALAIIILVVSVNLMSDGIKQIVQRSES